MGQTVPTDSIPFQIIAEGVRQFSVSAIPGSRMGFADTQVMRFNLSYQNNTYALIIPSAAYPLLRQLAFGFLRDRVGEHLDKLVAPIGKKVIQLTYNIKVLLNPNSQHWLAKKADKQLEQVTSNTLSALEREGHLTDRLGSEMSPDRFKAYLQALQTVRYAATGFAITTRQTTISQSQATQLAMESPLRPATKPVLVSDDDHFLAFEPDHEHAPINPSTAELRTILRGLEYYLLDQVRSDHRIFTQSKILTDLEALVKESFPDLLDLLNSKNYDLLTEKLVYNQSENARSTVVLGVKIDGETISLSIQPPSNTNELLPFVLELDFKSAYYANVFGSFAKSGSLTNLLLVAKKAFELSFWKANVDYGGNLASPTIDMRSALKSLSVLLEQTKQKHLVAIINESALTDPTKRQFKIAHIQPKKPVKNQSSDLGRV